MPSLSSVKSEFQKLYTELGGPADIGVSVDKSYLDRCCNEYRLGSIRPILLHFQSDATLARRHWPWAAFALSQYVFERRQYETYSDELRPEEVPELLSEIAKSAHQLSSGLCKLQTFANRLVDPSATLRRGHLAWLDAIVTQAAAGRISNDVNGDDTQMAFDFFGKMNLLARLTDVEVAAKTAIKHVDPKLLKRERGQSDPALPMFVFRCGVIWRSLTGRKPSAEKVERRNGSDPAFVVLVQELVKVGQAPPPSRYQVATSLQKFANSPTAEKSGNQAGKSH